jgi:aspartyl-tRNA(Asn)/glutamyl-tRNA(Gln) amidotransferase subunit C
MVLRGTIHNVPAPLTLAEVDRIATLAHLELTDEERHALAKQLADILAYVEQLQQIDTTGVPPMAHVNAHEAERDDEPRASLAVADAIANAPDPVADAGLFRVPRVIG